MIRIDPFPGLIRALETQRVRRLPELRGIAAARDPVSTDFVGYEVAREPLWEHQQRKCAWCDRDEELAAQPVEHYRPKARAVRASGRADRGYWWLAWTQENLLFACGRCNTGYKKDRFPLADEATVLAAEDAPPGPEQALILHPYLDDPSRHIEFFQRPDGRWSPRSKDTMGEVTIDSVGLEDLVDRYDEWVKDFLQRDIDRVRAALAAGRADDAQREWRALLQDRYNPRSRFRALTYAVLQRSFAAELASGLLTLEPPRTRARPPTPEERQALDLLRALPVAVQDAVHALGGAASVAEWDAALLGVLGVAPRTLDELRLILGVSASRIDDHLYRLRMAGKVVRDGDLFRPSP